MPSAICDKPIKQLPRQRLLGLGIIIKTLKTHGGEIPIILSVLFALSWLSSASAQGTLAISFDDYRVDRIYTGKNHPPLLDTKEKRMFRTVLRKAMEELPVDYAGHYVITYFGCGAGCLEGAAIDAITGKVIWFPQRKLGVTDYWEPISFCRNSGLLRLVGTAADKEDGDNEENYYELKNDNFVLIKHIVLPPNNDGAIGDGPAWYDHYESNPAYCHPVSETPRNN